MQCSIVVFSFWERRKVYFDEFRSFVLEMFPGFFPGHIQGGDCILWLQIVYQFQLAPVDEVVAGEVVGNGKDSQSHLGEADWQLGRVDIHQHR